MDNMMRNLCPVIVPIMLLGACDRSDDARDRSSAPTQAAGKLSGAMPVDATPDTTVTWLLQPSASGTDLTLQMPAAGRIMVLSCPAGKNLLHLNVASFTPIGSEERLSFGIGGEVEALVADVRGDRLLGGVSAKGAVPANLAGLLGGPVSVSYGAQISGPHPAVPRDIARSFILACRPGASAATARQLSISPCLVQDGQELSAQHLRATGTEPFWSARIEGRCVTYSHPEDQQGTRVWTRFTPTPQGGVWSGALGGYPFELQTRAGPGCSDGMSDKRYPVIVELVVHGERRKGCAEPI